MSKLRVLSFTISIDDYEAGPDQSIDNPLLPSAWPVGLSPVQA